MDKQPWLSPQRGSSPSYRGTNQLLQPEQHTQPLCRVAKVHSFLYRFPPHTGNRINSVIVHLVIQPLSTFLCHHQRVSLAAHICMVQTYTNNLTSSSCLCSSQFHTASENPNSGLSKHTRCIHGLLRLLPIIILTPRYIIRISQVVYTTQLCHCSRLLDLLITETIVNDLTQYVVINLMYFMLADTCATLPFIFIILFRHLYSLTTSAYQLMTSLRVKYQITWVKGSPVYEISFPWLYSSKNLDGHYLALPNILAYPSTYLSFYLLCQLIFGHLNFRQSLFPQQLRPVATPTNSHRNQQTVG